MAVSRAVTAASGAATAASLVMLTETAAVLVGVVEIFDHQSP